MIAHRRRNPFRVSGYFVPAHEVELYLFNGWSLGEISACDDLVLMVPPGGMA